MAINKKANKETKKPVNHEIEIVRAKEFDDCISFDMIVNGITVYGCRYRTYTDKKSGEERNFVAFPSYKAKNDSYYNHAWFSISDDDLTAIEKGIEAVL